MLIGQLNIRSATLMVFAPLLLAGFAGGATLPPASAAKQVTTQTPAARVDAAPTIHVVLMILSKKTSQFLYEPETVVVKVGDVVEWKNKDIYQHTVTSVKGKSLNSGNIKPGGSWRYKAIKRGTQNYYCTLHPNMRGKLIVR